MGNERQRKAIDSLREQVMLWAMQDIKIKRQKLAQDVRVDNPIGWLNKVVAKVCGVNQNSQVVEAFSESQTLVCTMEDVNNRVVFSPLSPSDIRRLRQERRSRLSQYDDGNPLLSLSRIRNPYEFSALNSGFLFDLELPLAWKAATGQSVEQMDRLWMYIMS